MQDQALKEYRETRIQTGSPVRLVSMLYDGLLRFIAEARAAIEVDDIPLRADRIHRAMRIVQELNNALEYSVDSDIPARLAALYDYVEYELVEATTCNRVQPLDNATRVLKSLADSWHELAEGNVAAADPTAPEPIPAPTGESDYSSAADERRATLSLSA